MRYLSQNSGFRIVNGRILLSTPYIRSKADFKTVNSGNANDLTTWQIKGENGTWYSTPYLLEEGNDAYIEEGFTITLQKDEKVKNILLNTTSDVVRINHNGYTLEVYGKLRFYEGSYPGSGTPSTVTSNGVLGWIGNGTFKFKGSADRVIMVQGEVNANNNNSGHNIYIDFSSGTTAYLNDRYRATNWDVLSGTLDNTSTGSGMTPFASTSGELRMGTNGGGSDTTPDGSFIIRSGATVIGSAGIFKKGNTAGLTFTLEQGATLRTRVSGFKIGAVNLTMSGTVILDGAAQNLPTASGLSSASEINNFYELLLSGSGNKTLQYNTTINRKLTLSGTAAVALNSKTLSYSSNADLEILTSMNRGSELPASSSGSSIPYNLILASGVTYNLGGATVNIRGTKQGDGAVSNGTLNENQS